MNSFLLISSNLNFPKHFSQFIKQYNLYLQINYAVRFVSIDHNDSLFARDSSLVFSKLL
jgi:hypothetical protein